jgi:drug/metabolite transporter (DMT)-like permease
LFAVISWGGSFVATKIALAELTPVTIIIMRMIMAVLLLFVIAKATKRDFSIDRKKHTGILLLALIAVFHLWIQVTGLKYTTASNTGWIIGITPVFMALLGYFFFREKLRIINMAGIVVAFFGLLLLISKGDFSKIDLISNRGDVMVLASAFTWSIYSLVNKKITFSYPPLMTILYLFITMAVILIPFNLSREALYSVVNLSWMGWFAVLFLGLICSGVSYVFWAQALKDMDSARVGSFLYFEPFVTIFTAWLILNEQITFVIVLSGVIITTGVILVNKKLRSL